MRTERRTTCVVCSSTGLVLWPGVVDGLFGVEGRWDVVRCVTPRCGTLWLDPRPVEADIGVAYDRYYTHPSPDGGDGLAGGGRLRSLYELGQRRYLADRFDYPPVPGWRSGLAALAVRAWPGRRADTEFLAFYQRAMPGGRLLDIGCGRGAAVRRLRQLGWDARGLERDPVAVGAAHAAGLPVEEGDITSTPLPVASFDVVTLSHVIEHVHDPLGLLCRCRDALRPGGRVVVVTPNADSWLHRRYGRHWRGLEPPRHLHLFTRASLTRLAELAGLRAPDVRTTIRGANSIALATSALRREGRFDGTVAPPPWRRAQAELVQQAAAVRLRLRPGAGEDLVLEATV